MRRAPGGRSGMGQWRRLSTWRAPGVDAKQPTREVPGTDGVGKARSSGQLCALGERGLPVASDIDDVGVVSIGCDGEVDAGLRARMQSEDDASGFRGPRQIE